METKSTILTKQILTLFSVLLLTIPFTLQAETYSYDDLGRLTKVVYDDNSSITYSYDKMGNRLQATADTEEPDGPRESITRLYVATFNRAPDSAGLNYWVNDSGLQLEQIAQSFFDQPETQTLYPPSTSNRDFIQSVYHNLFNRDPDSAGWDYWEGELNSGSVPKQVFILAVINGAQDTQEYGYDATILENKKEVGTYYAEKGLNDVDLAKEVMAGIDASLQSVDEAKAMIDAFIESGET